MRFPGTPASSASCHPGTMARLSGPTTASPNQTGDRLVTKLVRHGWPWTSASAVKWCDVQRRLVNAAASPFLSSGFPLKGPCLSLQPSSFLFLALMSRWRAGAEAKWTGPLSNLDVYFQTKLLLCNRQEGQWCSVFLLRTNVQRVIILIWYCDYKDPQRTKPTGNTCWCVWTDPTRFISFT